MKLDLKNLPSESDKLRQIIATLHTENNILLSEKGTLQSENNSLKTNNDSLQSEVELLKQQLKLLKAKRFGKSSEKLDQQIHQL